MRKEYLIDELNGMNFSNRIVNAFEKVDRTLFVPPKLKFQAYKNIPLPIGHGQTISQPYTIAFMLSFLDVEENQKILEIGSGSGYVLALLSELNKNNEILGIEIIPELAESSKQKLSEYKNVKVLSGDFNEKLSNEKFDRILVSAAFEELPQKLIQQNLKTNGILVAPVRDSIFVVNKKTSQEIETKQFRGFNFVPIISKEV